MNTEPHTGNRGARGRGEGTGWSQGQGEEVGAQEGFGQRNNII